MKRLRDKRHPRGFTLVEIIVVLVILGLLLAVAIPAVTGYIEKAEQVSALAEARAFGNAVTVGFAEWYASPTSHQPTGSGDAANKSELVNSMAALVKAQCGMVPTNEARTGSNRYQVVSSDMTQAKWTDFYNKAIQNPGKNRAAFYVKSVQHTYVGIAGVVYLSKDGRYVVRIIYDLGVNGCDFSKSDIGVYVEKLPLK